MSASTIMLRTGSQPTPVNDLGVVARHLQRNDRIAERALELRTGMRREILVENPQELYGL